jgi:hypothetical protein
VRELFRRLEAKFFEKVGNFIELLPIVQWEPVNIVSTWPLPDFSNIQAKPTPPGRGADAETREAYGRRDSQWVKQESQYIEKFGAAKNLLWSLVTNHFTTSLLEAISLTVAGKRAMQERNAPGLLAITRRAASTGTFVVANKSVVLERARIQLEEYMQADKSLMAYASEFKLKSQMYASARDDLRSSYAPDAEVSDDGFLGDEALITAFVRGLNTGEGTRIDVFEKEAYHKLQSLIRLSPSSAERKKWVAKHGVNGKLTVDKAVVFIQAQAEANLAEPGALGRLQLEYYKLMSKGAHATTTSRDEAEDDGDDEASYTGKGQKRKRKAGDGDSKNRVRGDPQKRNKLGICRACMQPGHFWGDGVCKKGKQWIKQNADKKAQAKAKALKPKPKSGKPFKPDAQATSTKAKGQAQSIKEGKALKAAATEARKKAATAQSSDEDTE